MRRRVLDPGGRQRRGGQGDSTASLRRGNPPGRAAALVVLNGSSTGQDAPADGSDASRLPGLARTLVERSVPAVIAMQAPVGNRYATDLMGCVYEELASWQKPRPLAALGHARRHIEDKRRADASALQPRRNGQRPPSSAPLPLRHDRAVRGPEGGARAASAIWWADGASSG